MHRYFAFAGFSCAVVALACSGCGRDVTDDAPPRPSDGRHAVDAGLQRPAPGAGSAGTGTAERPAGAGAAAASGGTRRGLLGDRLASSRPGHHDTRLTLTADSVVAGARPEPDARGAADRTHQDAVRVTVANTGWAAYQGGVADAFTLVDSAGHRHAAVRDGGRLGVGDRLERSGRLLLGERASGWVVFSLPSGAVPARLEFHWAGAKATGPEWEL